MDSFREHHDARTSLDEDDASQGQTSREQHLRAIDHWQATSGRTGAPPVALNKKLSNWIQWCRAQHKRGRLPPDVAAALASRGIALYQRGQAAGSAPRGLWDVIEGVERFVGKHHRAPQVLAADQAERHLGVWLTRLQAGLLPRNFFPKAPTASQSRVVGSVLLRVETVQTPAQAGAQWWAFTNSAVRVLNFETQGNRWQSAYIDYTLPGLHFALGADSARTYRRLADGDMPLPPLVAPTAFAQILSAALAAAAHPDRRVDLMNLWPFGEPLVRRLQSTGFSAWLSAEAFLDTAGCHVPVPAQDARVSVR